MNMKVAMNESVKRADRLARKNLHVAVNRLRPLSDGEGMIVVGGMPKSGTTAIAALLARATELAYCNDPFYQLDNYGVVYREELFSGKLPLKQLWQRYQHIFAGGVVKDPNFSLLLSDLSALFPAAKHVFLVRDPKHNIRSILNRLKLPGQPAGVQLDFKAYSTGWQCILQGAAPTIPGEDYIEKMARR